MQVKPHVAVLLATYKPFPYITEQIESIKKQIDVETTVFWGDDGSSLEDVNEIEKLLDGVRYVRFSSDRIGVSSNFLNLLRAADGFKYYAFCDQDDIWYSRKLVTQVNLIDSSKHSICGVHSHPDVLKNGSVKKSKANCVATNPIFLSLTNCCQGCTLVFNNSTRVAILAALPEKVIWHDWWVALIIASQGELLKTDEPLVGYRLHSNNTIGQKSLVKKALWVFFSQRGLRLNQVENLLENYGEKMNPATKAKFEELTRVFSGKKLDLIKFLLSVGRIRNSKLEDFIFKVRCILFRP
jgi:glycosyltransferase involved in cell wall biosynthesis